ncbi:MAG: phosphoglucosamine mutase, partial [Thermodesulfobacteriota bacterium]
NVITGDQIIAVCANYLKKNGKLKHNRVVTTVMSNIGLIHALKEMGIEHRIAPVGDRYVLQEMIKSGAVLGGEDSGHMIFLDHHTTGDGIFTALKLIEILCMESKPLSELTRILEIFPQVLMNIPVLKQVAIETVPEIADVIRSVESDLGGKGRVLVRYSGTQPLCRVMVEGPTDQETREYCTRISDVVRKTLGA